MKSLLPAPKGYGLAPARTKRAAPPSAAGSRKFIRKADGTKVAAASPSERLSKGGAMRAKESEAKGSLKLVAMRLQARFGKVKAGVTSGLLARVLAKQPQEGEQPKGEGSPAPPNGGPGETSA